MRLLRAAAVLFLSYSGAPGEAGLWNLPLAPTVWPPLKALLLQWPPSPLRGADIVQWSGVSWGRRLPPLSGLAMREVPHAALHAFQNIQRNSPCRHYANPERSLQKRSQKWLHRVGGGGLCFGSSGNHHFFLRISLPSPKPKSSDVGPGFSQRHTSFPESPSLHPLTSCPASMPGSPDMLRSRRRT